MKSLASSHSGWESDRGLPPPAPSGLPCGRSHPLGGEEGCPVGARRAATGRSSQRVWILGGLTAGGAGGVV